MIIDLSEATIQQLHAIAKHHGCSMEVILKRAIKTYIAQNMPNKRRQQGIAEAWKRP